MTELDAATLLAEARLLRKALLGMVGTDAERELERMEVVLRKSKLSAFDTLPPLQAIEALRRTRHLVG